MPSEKRARQRAGRQARMAEMRRAQQRRRTYRRGGVVALAVVIAALLAAYSSGAFNGGSKHKVKVTTPPATPGALTPAAAAALNTIAAPPVSSSCTSAPAAPGGTTTTVPASGSAVAKVAAPGVVPFPQLNGSSPHYTSFSAAPPFCINVKDAYTAVMKTDVGTMTIKLLAANAPVTVNNFVFLAGYHYFDGIVFHRVIPGFVDQGGDPTGTGTGGPGYHFADELPKSKAAYDTGAVAMANSGPNTNGSQFFLIVGSGGDQLTPAYSMFGQITSGINVMNQINNDGTSGGTPKITHHIVSVTITQSSPSSSSTTPPST